MTWNFRLLDELVELIEPSLLEYCSDPSVAMGYRIRNRYSVFGEAEKYCWKYGVVPLAYVDPVHHWRRRLGLCPGVGRCSSLQRGLFPQRLHQALVGGVKLLGNTIGPQQKLAVLPILKRSRKIHPEKTQRDLYFVWKSDYPWENSGLQCQRSYLVAVYQ